MAGFFGLFDFTKPGPGVEKDAPLKHWSKVFFQIYSRKFWNLMKINLLMFLFNLPAIIGMIFATYAIIPLSATLNNNPNLDLYYRFIFGSILVCVPVITIGPVQAGFTYVLRNYAREEHSFIWSDFVEHAKKNFKQSMIVSVIDFIAVIIMGININFYSNIAAGNIFYTIARIFMIGGFLIFIMMHMYIYPMMVTFKFNIRQLYKNALIFSFIKFVPNILVLALCAFILVITLMFNYFTGILLYVLITMSTIGLITNFYAFPVLKKYIIDMDPNKDSAKKADETDTENI